MRIFRIPAFIYTFLMLLIMGIGIGIVSLYFGAAYYGRLMFFTYFKFPSLILLNIFPVVLLIFLIYLISNRAWVSFLVTTVVVMLFSWVNYFKLQLRNDPLLAADLSLILESINMAGKYEIRLNWKMICVIAACVVGTLVSAFLVKGRIASLRLRLAGIALLLLTGALSFKYAYSNTALYKKIQNLELINRWSATQTYISKGFVYPFLYSIKTSLDKPPEGYDEKAAREKLFSYEYSDIPEDKKVNVIAIMLEAYNDFTKFPQLEFNIDVYGYFHRLKAESYSGELVTNAFAGGTIDTERCFLTGFSSLYNFRTKVNSYVWYFREQGYRVEGSHPCYDWFYNRKNVNEYMGFENYYYFENYYGELAGGRIAGDEILFPHIIKLYEANKATGKPYFSFNVTYQNHGPYPAKKQTDLQYVKNKGYSEEEYNILNNYFSGIYDTNRELESLIDYFREEEEPVVVILFSDHNPWMGDGNSVYKMLGVNFDLSSEEGFYNYYNAPYIIWANDSARRVLGNDFRGQGPAIGPGFLMNEFFRLAGYEGNEFMKLSNELKSLVDVVHATGRYKEAGRLTQELSSKARQKLNQFLQVQYYWRRNFRSSPK